MATTGTSTPVPASGTATPMVELNPEQAAISLKVSLADLCAKATALYAHKKYDEAAEVYAQAAEMQAEMNGEMSPENAEILFLYGRALFRVGQSKSDVLGGRAPETKNDSAKAKPKAKKAAAPANGKTQKAENGDGGEGPSSKSIASAIAESAEKVEEKVDSVLATAAAKQHEPLTVNKKPLFHFEGDENLVDSDEDEEMEGEEGEEGEEEEEDDDLAVAFEILDLARVLFQKRLDQTFTTEEKVEEGKGKEKATEEEEAGKTDGIDSAIVRHIKERLADTHDLLAEIELENERYPNAITDFRASLKYKQDLYPFESEVIAEVHYKLSLALEFASITTTDENTRGGATTTDDEEKTTVDQGLRDEAAKELEAAIASTRQKLQNKEVELATLHNPEDNDLTREQIADVKEVIADMEQRLVELKKPPVDLKAALGLEPTETKTGPGLNVKASEEAKKKATDVSGLVRKKRKADPGTSETEGLEKKKIKDVKEVKDEDENMLA